LTWLGIFPSWQGIGLQLLAGGFVIGSYALAERQPDRRAAGGSTSRRNPPTSTDATS
jgi:hypothetical protein